MFPLHAQTRRQLVLFLFAAACVVPTLGTAAWCAWLRLPWHARGEAAWIGHTLGMNASLERVRHPRPGQTQYLGLSLVDRESGRPVFSCRRLDIGPGTAEPVSLPEALSETSSAHGRSTVSQGADAARRPAVFVQFRAAQCHAAPCDEWIRLIESLLAGRVGQSWTELRCAGDRLEVVADGRTSVMTGVRAALSRTPEKTVLSLEFRPDGAPDAPSSRLIVVRPRKASSGAAQFELLCDERAPLPCGLLAWMTPALASAGPESEFFGRLTGRQTPDGWQYEVADACFLGIELERLAGDRLRPHRLQGIVDVQVDRATIAGGRLTAAEGSFGADQGRVNRSLVAACIACWGLEGSVAPGDGDLEIGRCQGRFLLDDRGLELRASPGNGRSLAFDGRNRPLLDESPARTVIPLASLLDVLAPRGETTAEDSPMRDALRRRLPLAEERAVAERPATKRR